MLGFEQTPTGYRATDEQVEWWNSRDTCPACDAICCPVSRDPDGAYHYSHDCEYGLIVWSLAR